MVDLTITPANVSKVSGNQSTGTAGEAIVAGQTVYENSTDKKWYLADADDTAVKAAVVGIALNDANADGQPLSILKSGVLGVGSGVTVGKIYVQSGTAGGVAPVDDLAQNDYVTILGIGKTAAQIELNIRASGVQVP